MVLWQVLGPLEVRVGHGRAEVAVPKCRAVLAALLTEPNRVVATESLVDELWGTRPPPTARKLVSGYVLQLRRMIDDPAGRVLVTQAPGYRVAASRTEVDSCRFEDLLTAGRDALQGRDAVKALDLLTWALELWRGPALADVPRGRLTNAEADRLEELRLAATELRIEASIACGRTEPLVAELRALTSRHPLRESLWHQLIRVLECSGRAAEALAAYARARAVIGDELGAEPGPELQRLHRRLLDGAAPARDRYHSPSRGPVPRQLPAAPPHFTGRRAELARLTALLPGAGEAHPAVPVCTIGGAAGIGKTALALHWSHRVADRFGDGQLYVDLRGFDPSVHPADPADALHAFLVALGVAADRVPVDPGARAALYRSLLAGRRMLVLLDNARDPAQVRPLLPGAAGCVVVVTSRDPLTGLATREGAHPVPLDVLPEADARQLLVTRLGAGRVDREPAAVATLLTVCAGLPLALSVVAGRAGSAPTMSLGGLADELSDPRLRLDALSDTDTSADVRTVLSWSYRNLTGPAARLFRLLGLHPGPDVTAPAAASLAGIPARQAQQVLADLVTAHLLTEPTAGRYAFHDLIRAYAAERVHAEDSAAARALATRRALDHHLRTAASAAVLLNPTRDAIALTATAPDVVPEQLEGRDGALAWFHAERAVLLRMPAWSVDAGCDTHAWQLAWALVDFLERQGLWSELADAQRVALDAAQRSANSRGLLHAHHYLGLAYMRLRAYPDAQAHLACALELCERLGYVDVQARIHLSHGRLLAFQSRYDEALGHAERSMRLFRSIGHRPGQANAMNNAGWYRAHAGDLDRALARCGEALRLFQDIGDRSGEARTWDSLGYVRDRLGHHAEAVDCYEQALALYRADGDRYNQAETLVRLGTVLEAAHEPVPARRAWREALTILRDLGHPDADDVEGRLAGPPSAP